MRKLFVIAALAIAPSMQGQVNFTVSTDVERMRIGDQVEVVINAVVHPNDVLDWPDFPGNVQFGEFINRSGIDTISNSEEELHLAETWTLTSFDSGYAVIAPLTLSVNNVAFASEPLLLQVDLAPNGDEYKDIEEPLGLDWPFWVYILSFGTVLIVILLLIFISNRARKKRPEYRPDLAIPLHIRAEKKMRELSLHRDAGELTNDEVLSRGTTLLQRYVKSEFKVDIFIGDQREWIPKLDRNGHFKSSANELAQLMDHASKLRFSGMSFGNEETDRWVVQASKWISASLAEPQPEIIESELV